MRDQIRPEQAIMPAGRLLLQSLDWAQFRQVLDSLPVRVALHDRKHRFLYANTEWSRFHGRPEEAVLGATTAELFGEEIFADERPWAERALAGEAGEWHSWLELPQGRRFVRRTFVPLRDAAGTVEGYFLFFRDLTDLRETERDLAEQSAARIASEALSAAIITSATDCIITHDEVGRVVEFNPAAEQTFGRRRADVLGHHFETLFAPPHLRRRYGESFAHFVASGARHGRRTEIEAIRADGTIFPAEVMITEVPLPGRRLFTAYLRDLTAVREAEAEIQRQRDALHQSEKMAAFGSLLAGVAHELNNPLSIVIGNALLLAEETDGSTVAERAQRVQTAAERCGRIVRSYLAMARQRKAEIRPVTVQSLADDALQLLAYPMRTSGVAVEQDIAPDMPALLCDSDEMIQVLSNLLTNARQVLEERPQPRRIRLTARADGEWAQIEVADNGPGIPDDIRSRVFDPFFTTKPVGSGTGIGLAVSRGIVEAHGGSLMFVPSAGGGACFVIRLPLARDASQVSGSCDKTDIPQQPMPVVRTALAVDDEPDIGALLAEMLQKLGYSCDVKTSGEAAQISLMQRDYDVVLCDLRLPGLDGPALYDWMAEQRPHLCARTAFITADTLNVSSHRFLARAGRPVLEKPFLPAELRELLAQLLPGAASTACMLR
jgi:PAS domain S-box-containing protein